MYLWGNHCMLLVWVGQECRGIDIQCITTAGLLLHCEGDPVDSLQLLSSQLYARLKQECYYRSVPLIGPPILAKSGGGLIFEYAISLEYNPPQQCRQQEPITRRSV